MIANAHDSRWEPAGEQYHAGRFQQFHRRFGGDSAPFVRQLRPPARASNTYWRRRRSNPASIRRLARRRRRRAACSNSSSRPGSATHEAVRCGARLWPICRRHHQDRLRPLRGAGSRRCAAQILKLRNDPAANAVMAGAFTQANAAQLSQKLGRSPSEGELYIAHFLGAGGAARLISARRRAIRTHRPRAIFPNAAHANRSIFYDRTTGAARSLAQVRDVLTARYDVARAASGRSAARAWRRPRRRRAQCPSLLRLPRYRRCPRYPYRSGRGPQLPPCALPRAAKTAAAACPIPPA